MSTTMNTSDVKIENCEVCGKEKAKYTCPKCEVRTCSLTCSNIHKKELNCDGIRDKTKFLPIKSLTKLELTSDYCLLQEVGRSIDKYVRDPLKRTGLNNFLPTFLRKLKYAAFKRGVTLEFLPRSFSRNKENTTRFIWNKNELLWRIEWIFPQAENVKWITEKASEKARLSVLTENILELEIQPNENPEVQNLKSILLNKLQFYRSAGLNGIKVLMKAEKVRNSNSRFYELDSNLTLAENLEHKTIIEFPTFYVILKDHSHMYEMIDSDDETEQIQKKNPRHRQKFRGNQNNFVTPPVNDKKPNLPNSNGNEPGSINFLFHTEFTDSEDEKAKLAKEKNTKKQERKRKFQKYQKEQTVPKKAIKTRDSVKEFTGICMSDSEDDVPQNENDQSSSVDSHEMISSTIDKKSSETETLINKISTSHITDSEDEGPEEKPIQRRFSNENEDSNSTIKEENTTERNISEKDNSIQSIAMNYFSAYMSDSEDETVSENPENPSNSGLQIPDYNVLVKMNQ